MTFILNALRSRWYHKYSVEDLSTHDQTVTCISLTDLSDRKIRPLSVLSDQGPSTFVQNSRGSKRPLSSASQLSFDFVLKAGNSSLNCSDGGYSSMNESLESLSRTDSIQNRSLRIWRKRRPWLANKQRMAEQNQEPDLGSHPTKHNTEILESVDEKLHDCPQETKTSDKTMRPRSVHFDTSEDSGNDENKENGDEDSENFKGSSNNIFRQSSIHLKSWQMRRQRRALKNMQKKMARRSCHDLSILVQTEERQP